MESHFEKKGFSLKDQLRGSSVKRSVAAHLAVLSIDKTSDEPLYRNFILPSERRSSRGGWSPGSDYRLPDR